MALPSLVIGALVPGCTEASVVTAPPLSPAPPEPRPAAPAPVSVDPVTVKLDGGCEDAKTAYVRECTENPRACSDGNASQLAGTVSHGAVLNGGTYIIACGTPATIAVNICAAIRNGRAVGVTVKTTPGDERIATCIGHAVQGLSFPSSPRLDVASTVFAAQ
jgi:hypothetical protein